MAGNFNKFKKNSLVFIYVKSTPKGLKRLNN